MSTPRRTTWTCANPLCARPIHRDTVEAIEITQQTPDGTTAGPWHLCDIGCAITYLRLCIVKGQPRGWPDREMVYLSCACPVVDMTACPLHGEGAQT